MLLHVGVDGERGVGDGHGWGCVIPVLVGSCQRIGSIIKKALVGWIEQAVRTPTGQMRRPPHLAGGYCWMPRRWPARNGQLLSSVPDNAYKAPGWHVAGSISDPVVPRYHLVRCLDWDRRLGYVEGHLLRKMRVRYRCGRSPYMDRISAVNLVIGACAILCNASCRSAPKLTKGNTQAAPVGAPPSPPSPTFTATCTPWCGYATGAPPAGSGGGWLPRAWASRGSGLWAWCGSWHQAMGARGAGG